MDRTEYLETARDNATTQAFTIRIVELATPSSQRGSLRSKRMRLLDEAARYQQDLIDIDAAHVTAGKPSVTDKGNMADLRDKVRLATSANNTVSAAISLANEVLAKMDEVRSV